MKHSKILAGENFFTKAGELDTLSTEPLTIAFLGGSLTEGEIDYEGTDLDDPSLKWTSTVTKFFSGLFPFRKITAIGAGLGGTGSDYGSVRFHRDVLSHQPDLIFIEFSCNDRVQTLAQWNEEPAYIHRLYLESIIRQCMEQEKIPSIIYMHVPLPLDSSSEEFTVYRKGCQEKQLLLDYYGIGTVDAMQELIDGYKTKKDTNPELTFDAFLSALYPQYADGSFNVHPYPLGYMQYHKSIVNAILQNPKKYLAPFQQQTEPYCREHPIVLTERYHYISASSNRIIYHGNWKLYTKEEPFLCNDQRLTLKERCYSSLSFPCGVMQTEQGETASLEFDTDANRICMPHPSAKGGLYATVYANGQKVGKITCHSLWHCMNYMGNWIDLPHGTKRIRFEVEPNASESGVFRFGYIVEAFQSQ